MLDKYNGAIWFIEEYLCYYNTIAMCYESYHSQKFEDIFENEFVEFIKFYNKYEMIGSDLDKEKIEFEIKSELRIMREIPLKRYLNSLKNTMKDLEMNMDEILDEYISKTQAFKISDTPNGELSIQMGLPIFVLNKIREGEES